MRHVLSSSDNDLAHSDVSINQTSEPFTYHTIEKRVRAQTVVHEEDSRESLEAKVIRLQKQNAALITQVSSLTAEKDAWRSECFRQLNAIDSVCQMIDGIQEDNRAQV
jgi:cell division protein FtsB